MLTYNILLLYIILVSIFFDIRESKKKKIIYLFLIFIPMTIIMGIRNISVGTDTSLYCSIFKYIANENFDTALSQYPIVWVSINKIISLIGTDNVNYIFSIAVLINLFVAKFIYDNSDDVKMSVILYILSYFYFNIGRQFLSMAICVYAYKYLNNKNKKETIKFMLLVLLAIGIHPTAIIFMLCILTLLKPKRKNIILCLISMSLIMVAFVPISNIFVRYFPHYEIYVNEEGITQHGFGVGKNRSSIMTLIYIFFELIMIYLFNTNKNNNIDKKILFNFIIINGIGCLWGIMSLTSIMFSRFARYFNLFSIIYIPYVFKYIKKDQVLIVEVIYFFIMFIPYYIQLNDNISGVVPYIIGSL